MIDDSIDISDMTIIYDSSLGYFNEKLNEAIQITAGKIESAEGKSMAVKSDTEEDRERLWKAVMDYGRGG
jgi:hypothetical protein